jgi:hypothetical protein
MPESAGFDRSRPVASGTGLADSALSGQDERMVPTQSDDSQARLLSDGPFSYILEHELRRGVRSQNFLSLLVLTPTPRLLSESARADLLPALAPLIAGEVRETDPLCISPPAELWLALLDTGLEDSFRVVDRILNRLEHHAFDAPFSLRIGIASSPLHATELGALRDYARVHLSVHWNTTRHRARQSMA